MRVERQIWDVYKETVAQPTANLDVLHRQGQQAQSGLHKFGSALALETGTEFCLGQLKNLTRCFEKVSNKYAGDSTRLHDIARGTIRVDNLADIFALERVLNPLRTNSLRSAHLPPSDFLSRWAEHGYFVRDFENKFECPSEAGFRSMDVKLQVPLSHGNYHITEIQVLHIGMEAAYAQSHALMETQREMDFLDPCARGLKDVDPTLARSFAAVTSARREIHDEAARRLGLGILEKPVAEVSLPRKFDIAA